MSRSNGRSTALALAMSGLLLLAACGQKSAAPAATAPSVQESVEAGGDHDGVCSLLSAAQVASVLPGSDAGDASDGGGSLIDGVESRQCSYMVVRGADLDLLTVMLTVARDDALFEQIKVTGFAFDEEDAVPVGDGGWTKTDGADQFAVVANKGRSVLRVELMAPGARGKADQLVALAQAVAAKL